MTYKLPDTVNPSKVFLINRSELEGRIDPNQYHIERKQAIAKLKKNNQLLKLKDVVKNVKTTTTQVSESDIYIGLENITSNTGEYIETKDKLSISSAGIFKKGQILFPKLRPYLNKVYLAEFDGICSTEFHIFKSDTFLNEFLTIYLRSDLIVNQTKHLMTGNTLPRLQTDDINNLPVPNISIEKQQEIVDLYNIAYTHKQLKEAQAKKLLESIDTYLLKELGITLPEKDNSLANRIFRTSFSEISGGRFDAFAILNKDFKIEDGFYPDKKLKLISNLNKGQSITSDRIVEGDIPVIAGGQSSPYYHNIYNYIGNVITISASGAYAGYIWYHNSPIFASDCTVIQSKNENVVSTLYLFEILKTKQQEIYHLQQGAGQPHVYSRDLEKLNIPLPPFEKQIELVNHIQNIRNQAKKMQEEAFLILHQAEKLVEKIILG